MGKAKRKAAEAQEAPAFAVDLKTVLAVKPEQRAKWILKACKHASNGAVDVKHLYDTLANKRIVQDVAEKKVGQRMFKALQDNIWVFSDKQQRYLQEDSPLATQFAGEDGDSSGGEDAAQRKARPKEAASAGVDAAARIEEMMARCRDFVREKADTYEDRQEQAKMAEKAAREARRREELERLRREWEQIAAWHRPLEDLELSRMAACDERDGDAVLEQRAKAIEKAEKKEKKRAAEESKARDGKDREAKESSRKRDRDRDRDRDRERRRRRRSSSS